MPFQCVRLLWVLGSVVAQDLFEQESKFLAHRGLTMQTVNPNETNLTAVASDDSWYKTICPLGADNWWCLDVPGGNAYNGNNLWLWECNGQDSQIWVFEGWEIRYGKDEKFCIDAGDFSDGNQLYLWDCNGMPQQAWGLDSDADRVYIKDRTNCLDFYRDQQWNGQSLHIWECNGLGNQEWGVYDADAPSGDPSPSPAPSPGGGGDIPSDVYMPDCKYAAPGWPTFNSQSELQADSEWSQYFKNVYGEIPSIGYPICVGAFTQIPKRGGLTSKTSQDCKDQALGSSGNGQLVNQMSPCCDPPAGLVMFIYNEKNTKHAVPANMWFESMHVTKGGDGAATWYYLVFGSAIWVNTGTTKVFTDHPDATKFLLSRDCKDGQGHTTQPPTECEHDFPEWFSAAVSKGLDTLQFTAHFDCGCGENGHGSWDAHTKLCHTEIIDLKSGDGTKACGTYKAGWAAQRQCECDSGKGYGNCKNYGF